MRVLVCGGRDYNDFWTLDAHLRKLHEARPFAVLIHGRQRGADTLAGDWARSNGIPVIEYPAEWRKHGGSRAGPIRNQRMLDEGKPDLVVGFPGGTGTADMLRRAIKAKVQVLDLRNVQ